MRYQTAAVTAAALSSLALGACQFSTSADLDTGENGEPDLQFEGDTDIDLDNQQ
jgi:hypothetical protein